MDQSTYSVHGIEVKIESNLNDFQQFIRRNYNYFLDNISSSPDIFVNFDKDAASWSKQRNKLRYFGEGLYLGSSVLFWENEYGFKILLERNNNGSLHVRAFHHNLISESDPSERLKDYQRSMRWCLHFPIFTLLKHRRGWMLYHASAVVSDNGVIAFCGLNKVGKSTLATYLCREFDFKLLTDNFLLVGPNSCYCFPEVLRLDDQSLNQFDIKGSVESEVYGKYHVDPEVLGIENEGQPKAFFIISRGDKPVISSIQPQVGIETMENFHSLLGEFPENSYMSIWPLFIDSTAPSHPTKEMLLEVPWYNLQLSKDWNLDEVANKIEKCI